MLDGLAYIHLSHASLQTNGNHAAKAKTKTGEANRFFWMAIFNEPVTAFADLFELQLKRVRKRSFDLRMIHELFRMNRWKESRIENWISICSVESVRSTRLLKRTLGSLSHNIRYIYTHFTIFMHASTICLWKSSNIIAFCYYVRHSVEKSAQFDFARCLTFTVDRQRPVFLLPYSHC